MGVGLWDGSEGINQGGMEREGGGGGSAIGG